MHRIENPLVHNVYIDAQLFAELIHFFPQIGNTDRRRRHIRNHHHNKIAGQNGLYLEDIGERFGRLRRIVRLPLLRTDVQGMDQIKKIAEWIGEIDA